MDAVNRYGFTPLRWAIESGEVECAALLVAKGAQLGAMLEVSWYGTAASEACMDYGGSAHLNSDKTSCNKTNGA